MEKLYLLYVEFCKANGLNFFLIPLIITLLIDITYLPYIKSKGVFIKLKTYQKVLIVESYFATLIMILAWILGFSDYILLK